VETIITLAMPRYFIWTIGCQMNKAESRRISDYLDSVGYRAAPSFQEADLIVLNTCVVRQSAEDKVLGTLGLLKGLKKSVLLSEYWLLAVLSIPISRGCKNNSLTLTFSSNRELILS
jgi:tRNA-i(6)A37 thiotransferase enzyme MiaB